jgi:hypothetical protein
MRCPNCGHEEPAGMRFCTACGAAMEAGPPPGPAACPVCGAPGKPGMKFCVNCGSSMEPPPGAIPDQGWAAPPPPPPGEYAAPAYPAPPPAAYPPPAPPSMPAAGPPMPPLPETPEPYPPAVPPAPAWPPEPQAAAPPPLPQEASPYAGYPPYAQGPPAARPRSGPGVGKIVGIVAVLAILGAGGYFSYRFFFSKPAPAETAAKQPQTPPATSAVESPAAPAQADLTPANIAAVQQAPAAPPAGNTALPSQSSPAVSKSTQSSSLPQRTSSLPGAPAQAKPSATATTSAPSASAPAAPFSFTPPEFPPAATERPPISATPAGAIPSPAAQPPKILKPEREYSPPAVQTPPPAKAPPAGPSSGALIWSGELRKGDIITIDGGQASSGTLQGSLPGVPVILETDFKGVGFAEMPGPSNGWKRVSFRSLRDQKVVVTLRWRTFQ